MKIEQADVGDYQALIALWEASVRATHHFLQEADITALKPLILEHYFAAVDLVCARGEEEIAGFCGVHDGNIEMLFIAPRREEAGSAACWWPTPSSGKGREGWTSTSRMPRPSASISTWVSG